MASSIEYSVKQCCLARAEEAGQEGDRHGFTPFDRNGLCAWSRGKYGCGSFSHVDHRLSKGADHQLVGCVPPTFLPIYSSSILIPRALSISRGLRVIPDHF